MYVIVHLSKHIECTAQRVGPNVDYKTLGDNDVSVHVCRLQEMYHANMGYSYCGRLGICEGREYIYLKKKFSNLDIFSFNIISYGKNSYIIWIWICLLTALKPSLRG